MKNFIAMAYIKFQIFIITLLWKIRDFCNPKSGDDMHTGELIVTGKGEADIELKQHPVSIKVFFDDEYVIVPCNHHHHDTLHWHVRNLHHNHPHDKRHDHCNHKDQFVLVVKWHVHNIRVIKWVIHY